MKCVLISCFGLIYEKNRIKPLESFFCERGYEFEYITTDFDHRSKIKNGIDGKNITQIKVLPYKKNLSLTRLLSHYFFSKSVYHELERRKPDLVYAMLPPNSLAWFMSRYKRKYGVRLIFDIYDLWPETFPSLSAKKVLNPVFSLWRRLRNDNLSTADFVITECNLFQSVLKEQLKGCRTQTIYPTLLSDRAEGEFIFDNNSVHLLYLGSINNIIGIETIAGLVESINRLKPTICHVVGNGENKDVLLDRLNNAGAVVAYYGEIHSNAEKHEILRRCHFGLNIMKETVCIGLTLKSIDYFHAGLPVLSNIKADTFELIESYKAGFNITSENVPDIASRIVNMGKDELLAMRMNAHKLFDSAFAMQIFNSTFTEVINSIQ